MQEVSPAMAGFQQILPPPSPPWISYESASPPWLLPDATSPQWTTAQPLSPVWIPPEAPSVPWEIPEYTVMAHRSAKTHKGDLEVGKYVPELECCADCNVIAQVRQALTRVKLLQEKITALQAVGQDPTKFANRILDELKSQRKEIYNVMVAVREILFENYKEEEVNPGKCCGRPSSQKQSMTKKEKREERQREIAKAREEKVNLGSPYRQLMGVLGGSRPPGTVMKRECQDREDGFPCNRRALLVERYLNKKEEKQKKKRAKKDLPPDCCGRSCCNKR